MMQFAVPLPWWLLALLAAGAVGVAWASYAGATVGLHSWRRAALTAVRAATLLALLACLLRPVRVLPPDTTTEAVVPILVDVSRSMSLEDVDRRSRIDTARDVLERLLLQLARVAQQIRQRS